MSCRHLAPRGRKPCYFPPNKHTRTPAHRVAPRAAPCAVLCLDVQLRTPVWSYYCVLCELVLSVNLDTLFTPTPPPPPGPRLVLFKQQTDSVGTHTHKSQQQLWSQADRHRQRLGEVERTARGCLQTTGNTPPSHEKSRSQKTLLNPAASALPVLSSLTLVCHSLLQFS